MTKSLKQIARRGVFPMLGLNGKPVAPPLPGAMEVHGQLTFSGDVIKKMTADIEAGLLASDGAKTARSLDALIHLLEMQVERLVDVEIHVKSPSWRTAVLRLAAARMIAFHRICLSPVPPRGDIPVANFLAYDRRGRLHKQELPIFGQPHDFLRQQKRHAALGNADS